MGKTNQMVEELEKFISQKVKSFNEKTSSEEILALSELVRATSIYKKVSSPPILNMRCNWLKRSDEELIGTGEIQLHETVESALRESQTRTRNL